MTIDMYAPQIIRDGKFVEPDESKLTPAGITALGKVRDLFNAVEAQQNKIETVTQPEITAALSAVAAGELLCKTFGPYTFHNLWRETVHPEH
jgi:hypothetical protein